MEYRAEIIRGDIWLVDLSKLINIEGRSSIQSGVRPAVISSNKLCNQYSPTITIVPISSKIGKNKLPTHVYIGQESGLLTQSVVLCEQILTIDKTMLIKKVGECNEETMRKIFRAIKIQTGEAFDINRINEFIKYIDDANNMIERYSKYGDVSDLIESRNGFVSQLKTYCEDFGVNYMKFFNNTISVNRIGEHLGGVVNAR